MLVWLNSATKNIASKQTNSCRINSGCQQEQCYVSSKPCGHISSPDSIQYALDKNPSGDGTESLSESSGGF